MCYDSVRLAAGCLCVMSLASYALPQSISQNGDEVITVNASRKVHIESDVCSDGVCTTVVFDQSLEYSNVQSYLDNLNIQNVLQLSSGTVLSTHNGVVVLKDDFSYPFAVNITSINSTTCAFW